MTSGSREAPRRVWRAADASRFVWRAWDDDVVLFDSASGDTHLLNQVSVHVLRGLMQCPSDSATLARRVASELSVDPDPDWPQRLETLLARFDELGLIESMEARDDR